MLRMDLCDDRGSGTRTPKSVFIRRQAVAGCGSMSSVTLASHCGRPALRLGRRAERSDAINQGYQRLLSPTVTLFLWSPLRPPPFNPRQDVLPLRGAVHARIRGGRVRAQDGILWGPVLTRSPGSGVVAWRGVSRHSDPIHVDKYDLSVCLCAADEL